VTDKELEKRACERFVIQGAVVYWKRAGLVFSGNFTEDYYPVFDISRGGLRFLNHETIKLGTGVELKIVLPGESEALLARGRVAWTSLHPGKSYKYQVGIQFAPFGGQKGQNTHEALSRIIALEERFKSP
jgi:Tfp pilus assembly protein PilZ